MSSSGYSGTPLAKKLGIKPDSRVTLVGAPKGFSRSWSICRPVCDLTTIHASPDLRSGSCSVEAGSGRPHARGRARDGRGSLGGVAKKASGIVTDVNEKT